MKYTLQYTLILFSIYLFLPQLAVSQRKVSIIGTVTDKKNNKALTGVSVYNINQGTGTITDSSGRYKIKAENYNRIVFTYIGYVSDTIRVNAVYSNQKINIQLKEMKYSFEPVDIYGEKPNYRRDSLARRKWFSTPLNENKVNGWGAVSHPISALFDAISGKRKRLWKFQKAYKKHEQRKYVQSRVQPKKITELFHLEGDSLNAFLIWYNPNYYFVRNASDYELLVDIKKAIKRFRQVFIMKPNMNYDNPNIR